MAIRTTRRRLFLLLSGLLPLLSRFTAAQKPGAPATIAAVFDMHMQWMEQSFIPAAEAMPGDKFFWAPTSGEFKQVRTFAEQLLHVGEVNFLLAAAILGEKPPAGSDLKTMTAQNRNSRSAILKYLKNSFSYTHQALASISEQNARIAIQHPILDLVTTRMGLGIVSIAHPFNHYGQIVEYLRMNNIVPPASRS